jgi:hypothetical protein
MRTGVPNFASRPYYRFEAIDLFRQRLPWLRFGFNQTDDPEALGTIRSYLLWTLWNANPDTADHFQQADIDQLSNVSAMFSPWPQKTSKRMGLGFLGYWPNRNGLLQHRRASERCSETLGLPHTFDWGTHGCNPSVLLSMHHDQQKSCNRATESVLESSKIKQPPGRNRSGEARLSMFDGLHRTGLVAGQTSSNCLANVHRTMKVLF